MISCDLCGCLPTRLYPAGNRCADCTPAACAGRPEPPEPTGRLDTLAHAEHQRLLDVATARQEKRDATSRRKGKR